MDEIVVECSGDYNIVALHLQILKALDAFVAQVPELELLIKSLTLELQRPQTIVNAKYITNEIVLLKKKIDERTECQVKYIKAVSPIVQAYGKLGPRRNEIGKSTSTVDTNRLTLVNNYFTTASEFVPLQRIDRSAAQEGCSMCGHLVQYVENGVMVCGLCGAMSSSCSNKLNKKAKSHKAGYENRKNFHKALVRFRGGEKKIIPQSLFDALDNYFKIRNQPLGKFIRTLPLDERGRKAGTNLSILIEALRSEGLSSYFENIRLISHLYWGWTLPNTAHLEATILNDYDRTQKVYESLPKSRTSSLGVQLRLCLHLMARGCPYQSDDFKITDSRESIEPQLSLWKEMCDGVDDLAFENTKSLF